LPTSSAGSSATRYGASARTTKSSLRSSTSASLCKLFNFFQILQNAPSMLTSPPLSSSVAQDEVPHLIPRRWAPDGAHASSRGQRGHGRLLWPLPGVPATGLRIATPGDPRRRGSRG
jgi:hypothetical protein